MSDLRLAVRLMLRSPGLSLVLLLTLALGIGANTAVFSVVNAVLLRPLPYADPDRLVTVWQDLRPRGGPPDEWATPGNLSDWRAETGVFERMAAAVNWTTSLTGAGEPVGLAGAHVTGEYFATLGVRPALGRDFSADDDRPGAARVVVLGDALWRERFAADPAIVGRVVVLGDEPHTIIGVMPPGFVPVIVPNAQLWRPMRLNLAAPSRGAVVLRVIARLRDGVSREQAQARMDILARQLEARYPDSNTKAGIAIVGLQERQTERIRLALLVLFGAVACVLLIACANVANLLLARAAGRSREMAVRAAIGASRARIARQLLTESGLIAALGGTLGVIVAQWTLATLLVLVPQPDLLPAEVPIDRISLLFTIGISCLAALLCGLVPALQAGRADQAAGLRDGARGTGGRPAPARRALVVAQLATALVLLIAAGLLGRSFLRLVSVDLGFEPRGLLTTVVTLPAVRYADRARVISFYDRLHQAIASAPGVRDAALTSVLPLTGDNDASFEIEGRPSPRRGGEEPVAWYRAVSADYIATLRLRIVNGRDLMAHEAAPALLVNETMARRYWPTESPVGHRLRMAPGGPWFTIVGIVQDIRHRGPSASPVVEMFTTYDQLPERQMGIVLRADGDAALHERTVARAVRALDPSLPVPALQPLDALVADAVAQPRFVSMLTSTFAALALTLAALGLYGLVAWSVAQRTTEFGLRMALGALGADVLRLVLREAFGLAAAGVVLGIAGALAVTRLMSALLFGVSPTDPLVFTATAGGLAAIVLAAGYLPARRATRVDPMVALRHE